MISLYDALIQGKQLKKGMPVKLPLVGAAETFGFVPITNSLDTDIVDGPNEGAAYVIGNRVISSLDNKLYRFPIWASQFYIIFLNNVELL